MDTYRTMKIVAIMAASFTTALYIELPSPTLSDLRIFFNASYEELGRAFSGRVLGAVISSLTGWQALKTMDASLDLLIGLLQIVAAITVASTPFCPDLNTLWIAFCLTGFCFILTHMASLQMSLQMATSKSPYLVHMMFLSYPIGATIVPLIAAPFMSQSSNSETKPDHAQLASSDDMQMLSDQFTSENEYISNMTALNSPTGNETTTHHVQVTSRLQDASLFSPETTTNVQWAFFLVASVTLISGLVTCICYIRFSVCNKSDGYKLVLQDIVHEPNPEDEIINENKTSSHIKNAVTLKRKVCIYLVVGAYFAVENNCKNQLTIFAGASAIKLFYSSSQTASYLTSLYWVATIVGRLISTASSSTFNVRKLLTIQILMFVLGCLTFTVFGVSSFYVFSTCAVFVAFASSSLLPLGINYVNDTMFDMKDHRLIVFYGGRCFGELTGTWLTAALFDRYGPASLFYMINSIAVALLAIFALMRSLENSPSLNHIS